jgi:hypothetical protein
MVGENKHVETHVGSSYCCKDASCQSTLAEILKLLLSKHWAGILNLHQRLNECKDEV